MKPNKLFSLLLSFCVLLQSSGLVPAWGATSDDRKEQIVLLPVRGQGMTEGELSLYRDAVAQGLSSIYTVKYGEQVDRVIQEVFAEESKSGLECDEGHCYRDIATMLNAKLVAKTTIIPRNGDYQISMIVYDVYENNSVATKVDVCKKCESDQLMKMLVALAASQTIKGAASTGSANKSAANNQKSSDGIKWYWWVLGAVVVGGAAAAAGGGKGGGGNASPSTLTAPGSISVHW